ncbi:twin-arginine translocase subunit TatC [Zhongshania sp.]|uniref:twin-arginine translocase subunit TatC n=1 Tax=Zhongshania sp. TaxID=1971902 RepID=UPI00356847A5
MIKNTNTESTNSSTLATHLTELRDRLIISLAVLTACSLCLIPFSQDIYHLVADPLLQYLPKSGSMIATEVTSTFIAPLKLVLCAALTLSMPVFLHQLWGLISPGLYRSEQKCGIPLLISSVLLFYLGVAFAFYVAFPLIFSFFSGATPEGVSYTTPQILLSTLTL